MLNIKTNIPGLQSLNNLKAVQKRMSSAMEGLSSGLRVNSAADDAAGLSIANRMTANLRASDKLTQGINDGISLMQVAEGGLNSINEILQRSRELAVQAANGTLSDGDRASINAEYKQLKAEIDRISRGTEAFGKHPLAPGLPEPTTAILGNTPPLGQKFPVSGSGGSFSSGIVSTAYVPAGAKNVTLTIDSLGADDDIQLFARDGTHLVGTPLLGADADIVWMQRQVTDGASAKNLVLTTENGFLPTASYSDAQLLQGPATYDASGGATGTYNGMTFTYSGDGDRYEDALTGGYNNGSNGANRVERLNIDEATEDLVLLVVGQGAFTATVTWDTMPSPTVTPPPPPPPLSTPTEILLSASYGNRPDSVTIEPTPSDSASLGLADVELDPIEKAREALSKLQQAMNKVDRYRGQYGALSNRFEGAIVNLVQEKISTASARSRIVDADYAKLSAELVRTQILQQAGTAMLSQAGQLPQAALTLLR
ncbi:flagellin N-terminal helical domain-containing protein [Geopseudomonas guangdongensis]|uniref:Flagellin n=1 Tax=Geopseudomonas guangdongensis TaxID=1245526 RepID=A0A1H2ENM8_9GAMM|nr:flagellin [Pseudomonas guangdongensis]SDT96348.1 flagellin [Pseudomonas guangdongensis]